MKAKLKQTLNFLRTLIGKFIAFPGYIVMIIGILVIALSYIVKPQGAFNKDIISTATNIKLIADKYQEKLLKQK